MNLSQLIDTHRGARSYVDLSRDCGGSPSDKRLQQLVRNPMKNFPDPETVKALSKGLRVPQSAVVLAAAESLGLDVRTSSPRLVELLPAAARDLSERQSAAIAHLVETIVEEQATATRVDIAWGPSEPTVAGVLEAKRKHAEELAGEVDPDELPAAARFVKEGSRGQARRSAMSSVGEEDQGEGPEGGA